MVPTTDKKIEMRIITRQPRAPPNGLTSIGPNLTHITPTTLCPGEDACLSRVVVRLFRAVT